MYCEKEPLDCVTRDHKRSSHFEDSIAITEKGVKILTRV